jgi:DNA invertase Pin-like site-specific DNA recombinase
MKRRLSKKPSPKAKRKVPCYAYLRVSGRGQEAHEKDGFGRQEREIRAFAKSRGYVIRKVYRETVSGTLGEDQRPVFYSMIQDLLANGVATILCEGMDRLARSVTIAEHLILYMASKGFTLISCATGEDLCESFTTDPMKRALCQMQGVFSELEKNRLVVKLRKSREAIRANGRKCEGRPKYGATPDEKAEIKYMRRLRRQGKTYAEIARRLNAKGVPAKAGGSWSDKQVHRTLNR